jgi:hypothetical protein
MRGEGMTGVPTARVILDAFEMDSDEYAVTLATVIQRALRANAIANTDDYNNQLANIRHLLGIRLGHER